MKASTAKHIKKAIKAHTCGRCNGQISKGAQYYRFQYPLMRGCSPEKLPDDVLCFACLVAKGWATPEDAQPLATEMLEEIGITLEIKDQD